MNNFLIYQFLFTHCLVVTTLFFLFSFFFGGEAKKFSWEAFAQNLKALVFASWYNPEVLSLKLFWRTHLKSRLSSKSPHLLWELPFLAGLSFFTLIRTRFAFLQAIIIYRAVFFCILFGNCDLLVFYSGSLLGFTAVVSIPWTRRHFAKVYYPLALKDLGWNTLFKALWAATGTGGKAMITVGGSVILNEVVSVPVGVAAAENYKHATFTALDHAVESNKVLVKNGFPPKPLPPLFDPEVYVELRRINLLKKTLEILPFFPTDIYSKKK